MHATIVKKQEMIEQLEKNSEIKKNKFKAMGSEELIERAREIVLFKEFTRYLIYSIEEEDLELQESNLTVEFLDNAVAGLLESVSHPNENDFYAALHGQYA